MSDDRVSEVAETLQVAALEMIGAARSFLDALEAVVRDPDQLESATASVSSLVDAAAAAFRGDPPPTPDADAPGAHESSDEAVA